MTENTILLATSASRPEYKRDFLTCLASPARHRVAFSYRKSWFQPELLSTDLTGRTATIVFCEPKAAKKGTKNADFFSESTAAATEFSFLAIRHVVIRALTPPHAQIADLRPTTAITVEFELGRLVKARDTELPTLQNEWDDQLHAQEPHPRPSAPGDKRSCFVLAASPLRESDVGTEEDESWRTLSVALGECRSLEGAFFFRVGAMRTPAIPPRRSAEAAASSSPRATQIGELSQVYKLSISTDYELPLAAYSASGATPYSQAIATSSSSSSLTVQAVTQQSAGRASAAVLVIRTGEVFRPEIGTVIIEGATGFEHDVPRVEIAARVTRNNLVAFGLVVAIAVFLFLAGLAKGAFGLSDTASYAINGAGAVLAALFTVGAIGLGIKS